MEKLLSRWAIKLSPTDSVQVGPNNNSTPETKRYVLLNKPKGFGTSIGDARARRGVLELVQKACKEPIRSNSISSIAKARG